MVSILALALFFRFDLFERLTERFPDVDRFEIDEIILAFAFLSFFFLVFAIRRWLDQKRGSSQLAFERKRLQETNRMLSLKSEELERYLNRSDRIGEFITYLQVARTKEEAYRLFNESLGALVPESYGALYIIKDSRNQLNRIASWGVGETPEFFSPQECWGLRIGKIFVRSTTPGVPRCGHYGENGGANICIPLTAHGELLGLLYLWLPNTMESADEDGIPAQLRRTLMVIKDQISLALSNLALNEKLKNLAIHDPLTGLYNRQYMNEMLEKELNRAKRNGSGMGVLLLDIDHFKAFNDTFGHSAGDVVLKEIGQYLKAFFRGEDYSCRYGGEEFLMILTETNESGLVGRFEKLRTGISTLEVAYRDVSLGGVTASMGVALYPKDGKSIAELIDAADKALYRAKEEGRDRVCFA